jgi:hypothetical protein
VKTSAANLEFSYDSQNRAEVASGTGNIVNFDTTASLEPGTDHLLFQKQEQSAALQLALYFFFAQTQRSSGHCGIEKIEIKPMDQRKSRPRAAFRAE